MEFQSQKIIKDNELIVIKIEDLKEDKYCIYYEIIYNNFTLPITCKPKYELFKNFFKYKKCALYFYKNKKTNEYIGVCMIEEEYNDTKDLTYLSDFCINKEHRNKGFGKDFLIKIIDKLKKKNLIKLYLDVKTINEVAIKLYTNNGFIIEKKVETNICENYYILSYILFPEK